MSHKSYLIVAISFVLLALLLAILAGFVIIASAKPIDPPYPGTAVKLTPTLIKADYFSPINRPMSTSTPCPVKERCDWSRP